MDALTREHLFRKQQQQQSQLEFASRAGVSKTKYPAAVSSMGSHMTDAEFAASLGMGPSPYSPMRIPASLVRGRSDSGGYLDSSPPFMPLDATGIATPGATPFLTGSQPTALAYAGTPHGHYPLAVSRGFSSPSPGYSAKDVMFYRTSSGSVGIPHTVAAKTPTTVAGASMQMHPHSFAPMMSGTPMAGAPMAGAPMARMSMAGAPMAGAPMTHTSAGAGMAGHSHGHPSQFVSQRLFGESGTMTKAIEDHYRERSTAVAGSGTGDLLRSSKLDPMVKRVILEHFTQEHDLMVEYIEESSIRLLEEIYPTEACQALNEFVERYLVAKHKIKKSRAGYLRGVCQKYWKANRARIKENLLVRARNELGRPTPGQLSRVVVDTIMVLFTPASGLSTAIIDDSVEHRLLGLTDEQAIEALYEFCSAVMYRQDRIRNLNAYLMSIIKKKVSGVSAAYSSSPKFAVPVSASGGHQLAGASPAMYTSQPMMTSAPAYAYRVVAPPTAMPVVTTGVGGVQYVHPVGYQVVVDPSMVAAHSMPPSAMYPGSMHSGMMGSSVSQTMCSVPQSLLDQATMLYSTPQVSTFGVHPSAAVPHLPMPTMPMTPAMRMPAPATMISPRTGTYPIASAMPGFASQTAVATMATAPATVGFAPGSATPPRVTPVVAGTGTMALTSGTPKGPIPLSTHMGLLTASTSANSDDSDSSVKLQRGAAPFVPGAETRDERLKLSLTRITEEAPEERSTSALKEIESDKKRSAKMPKTAAENAKLREMLPPPRRTEVFDDATLFALSPHYAGHKSTIRERPDLRKLSHSDGMLFRCRKKSYERKAAEVNQVFQSIDVDAWLIEHQSVAEGTFEGDGTGNGGGNAEDDGFTYMSDCDYESSESRKVVAHDSGDDMSSETARAIQSIQTMRIERRKGAKSSRVLADTSSVPPAPRKSVLEFNLGSDSRLTR